MHNKIQINANFDGGNIICHSADNPESITLEIEKDAQSEFRQWFYFSVSGVKNESCKLRIKNASECAYPQGWEGYQTVASYDRIEWFRVSTGYKDGELVITHTPDFDLMYFAYFAPYSMERHADMLARWQTNALSRHASLGKTIDGQSIDMLTIGVPAQGKLNYWITARQHPGETMAEWWMEGFIERLLDSADPVSMKILDRAVFHIVPNMNPDGSRRGHLRTNAVGTNLNREWDKASLEKSPEVSVVLRAMEKTGIDFALDVHGDEALPYVFIAGAEGVPNFTEKDEVKLQSFLGALKNANSDFQTEFGYPRSAPGTANLGICTNYLAYTFDCLAMTLEMPFKDNANDPDDLYGWSPGRCKKLGADSLTAMLDIADSLA